MMTTNGGLKLLVPASRRKNSAIWEASRRAVGQKRSLLKNPFPAQIGTREVCTMILYYAASRSGIKLIDVLADLIKENLKPATTETKTVIITDGHGKVLRRIRSVKKKK
jgi:hypothetical protein